MKVGDCVRVPGDVSHQYAWVGVCTWTDGYKFEFLIDGKFDTWTSSDLEILKAKVINESR